MSNEWNAANRAFDYRLHVRFLGDVVKVAIKDAKGDKVQAGMMKKASGMI